jgi:hypothetical protein
MDKYSEIWEQICPCVQKCILNDFSSLEMMLCGHNWAVVHVRCKEIISKYMASMHIKDPHQFDKAVCWKAVKEGWDRDPKWRGICSFFFAAAMELEVVERLKVKSGYGDISDLHRQLIEIIQKMQGCTTPVPTAPDFIKVVAELSKS